MAATLPQTPVQGSHGTLLQANASWHKIDFISDLHLQAAEPATFMAWQEYMARHQSDAVFILGDLFEAWIGDDVLDDPDGAFERQCANVLHTASQRYPVFFMHGNRDFLIGPAFAKRCGITLLNDPVVLVFGGHRWLLTHGDALCVDDHSYMAFRSEVRTTSWQQSFLTRPLAERRHMARAMRDASQQAQRETAASGYADVDRAAARIWLQAVQAPTMLHGHTHRPATHALGHGLQRVVLSDWDASATPPRTEVLRLSLNASAEPAPRAPHLQRITPV